MATLYIYVLDTLADWEIGHLTAEVYSRRFFRKDAGAFEMKFVGSSLDPIKTMGGLTILPELVVDEIEPDRGDILLLPGADTWSEPKHFAAVQKANAFLAAGETVAAICGATVALAFAGLLDARPHTSNGAGFLDMFVPTYQGKAFYRDEKSVVSDGSIETEVAGEAAGGEAGQMTGEAAGRATGEAVGRVPGTLITAGSTGGLLFAKYILEKMDVMSEAALEAWYQYFSSGDAGAFFALMRNRI